MSDNNTFSIVYKYYTLGRCVIPSGGGPSSKSPLVPWTEFQKRLPTEDELRQWQSQFNSKLWGMVTGKISGIFVADAARVMRYGERKRSKKRLKTAAVEVVKTIATASTQLQTVF